MWARGLLIGLVVLIVPRVGRAQPDDTTSSSFPMVAFAAYTGHAPERESPEVSELRAQLEHLDIVAQPGSILPLLGQSVPLPGILDHGATAAGLTSAELLDAVEVGYQAWSRAKFEDAVTILTRALARIRRNPALLVTDTSNLVVIYKAHLTLALSLAKLERTAESEAMMEELIRVFPAQPIVRAVSGPEAWELYRSVAKHVRDMGEGRLVVDAGSRQAIIFVDGQLRGTSHVDLPGIVPGVHRVFIQVVGTSGRQYQIKVAANKVNTLKVSWEADQAIWLTETSASIVFPTEADRAKEGAYVRDLIRRWRGQEIAIISPRRAGANPAISAMVYDANGDVVRGGVVELDRDKQLRIRALAKFAKDGTPDASVTVTAKQRKVVGARDGATRDGTTSRQSRWVAPTLMGVGLAAVVGGVIVFKENDHYLGDSFVKDGREIGLGISMVGSATIGAGTYLWCRERLGFGRLPAGLIAGGTTALAYGVTLFVVDQDPGRQLPPTIIDSATAGVVVGGAGLALAGAGLWLTLRGDANRPPPVVALQRGGALLSWGGSF